MTVALVSLLTNCIYGLEKATTMKFFCRNNRGSELFISLYILDLSSTAGYLNLNASYCTEDYFSGEC